MPAMEPTITITTERNPRRAQSVREADSDDSNDVRPALRQTDEYAAAFNLEVWKAQQQARFRAQLRQAKAKLEKKICAELTSRDQRKLDELENTRKELEVMALRLEASGVALQNRQAQLEARENAFEARRMRVAEQHETHLNRVERRAKQALEDAAVVQDNLKAQLREKEITITQTQERLRCAQQEYDSLQKRTARCLTEKEENGDAARLREAEERLNKANTTIQLLQDQLREQTDRVDRLSRERDILAQQQHENRMQIHQLMREQSRLAKVCASWESAAHRNAAVAASSCRPPQAVRGRSQSAQRQDDVLLKMLHDLKREVAEHMDAGGDGCESFSSAQPLAVVCETEANPSGGAYLVAEEIGGFRAPRVSAEGHLSLRHADAGSSDRERSGTLTDAPSLNIVQRCPISAPISQPVQEETNTSLESGGARRYVAVQSWQSSQEGSAVPSRRQDRSTAMGDERNEEGVYRERARPPLAPSPACSASRETPRRDGGRDTADVAPSPADFARAATTASDDAATTRAEMVSFVRQMKVNREKLLETGVYSVNHPVVKEMTEKIELYEQYLARY